MLIRDLLVSLIHSTYVKSLGSYDTKEAIVPESYLVNMQLPAFVGRHKELEGNDICPPWSISNTSVMQQPLISNDLDWILRLSESNSLAQRYMRSPFLLNKKKACFKFTVLIKSIVPL